MVKPGGLPARSRIYDAALAADMPVTPPWLAEQAVVPLTAMGTYIKSLLEGGWFRAYGQVVLTSHARTGAPYRRRHILYGALTSQRRRGELASLAPGLWGATLRAQLEAAILIPEAELLLAVLVDAAEESLRIENTRYFATAGFRWHCTRLGIDAGWAAAKWRAYYTTVLADQEGTLCETTMVVGATTLTAGMEF